MCTFAALAILYFFTLIIDVYLIYENPYFANAKTYPNVIVFFLLIMLIAIILWLVYFIAKDSPGTRKLVPLAYFLYAVALFFYGIWVCFWI